MRTNPILAQADNDFTASMLSELTVATAIRCEQLNFFEVQSLDESKFKSEDIRLLVKATKAAWLQPNKKPTIENICDQLFGVLVHDGKRSNIQANEEVDKFEADVEVENKPNKKHIANALAHLSSSSSFTQLENETEELAQTDTDLLSFISSENPISLFASELARAAKMPRNTTFLVTLGIVSAITCRTHSVSYRDGRTQPTSLFIAAEQPPATAKSRILSQSQSPIFSQTAESEIVLKTKISELAQSLKELEAKTDSKNDEKEQLQEQILQLEKLKNGLFKFITDATPEALDMILSQTNGFYAISSAEQAAVNSLMGMTYGSDKESNKDLILKGYNGEYHNSKRRSRETYSGNVVGSICVLAQNGMIDNILKSSGSVGVFERFIVWAEPHLLGQRNHLEYFEINENTLTSYNEAVEKIYIQMNSKNSFGELPTLNLSARSWKKIDQLKHKYEPTLADGAENSINVLRGVIGKIDILIMKLSSVLHLLVNADNPLIHDDRVDEAIQIAETYITHLKEVIKNTSVQALSDRDKAIIEFIGNKARTGKEITDKLYRRAVFHEGNKISRKNVQTAVTKLIQRGLIVAESFSISDFNSTKFILA